MSRSAQLRGHGDRTTDPAPLGRIVAQYEGTLVSPIIPPVLRSGVTRSRLVYFPRSGSAIALLRISNKVSLSPFILSASESMRRCTVTRANSFLSIVLDPELPCSRQRRSSGRISEECARSVHLDRSIDRAQIDPGAIGACHYRVRSREIARDRPRTHVSRETRLGADYAAVQEACAGRTSAA